MRISSYLPLIRHMLIGEFSHTIDEKGRTSLPSKFRKEMGAKVVIAPGIDNCLFIFTMKEWSNFALRLSSGSIGGSSQSVLQADNRNFNRLIIGRAVEVEVDGSGRVLLPEHLREYAGLGTDIVILGVVNRVEVWSKSSWQAFREAYAKKADALAEKLGSAGIVL
jgi:MraZ protein